MNAEEQKLYDFLQEIQLEQFFGKLNSELHVTRLSHFDYVDEEDLTIIGMSKPDLRRLFDNLKKLKKKGNTILNKLKRSIKREPSSDVRPSYESTASTTALYTDPSLLLGFQTPASPTNRGNIDVRQGLKCLIHEKEIQLDDFLGRGAFGYVRKGIWTTDTKKTEVAVKCLKSTQDAALVQLQNEFIKEANAMSNLDHPNLIRLYGIVLASPMMLVTELAPLGSLLGRLRSEPEKFLISTLCSIVVQIASGMKYLEENRFVHRDLAARNILLMSYEKIKIGDFGLMRALPTDMDYYIMQPNGLVPYAWCAPECLQYRKFSHASDIWAFGVTVIEIFSYGKEPWPGLNGAQILEKIKEPNYCRPDQPDHCPVGFYGIIKTFCWHDNPDKRGTFTDIEKRLLASLPTERLATFNYTSACKDTLAFEKGDTLTLFEQREDQLFWKGQNRMTSEVGYIPVNLFPDAFVGASIEDPKELVRKSSRGREQRATPKRMENLQRSRRVTGSFLDYDSASLSSGSSTGSNENDPYRLPTSQVTKALPIQGQTLTTTDGSSSGYSSGGPSLENSFRDEVDGFNRQNYRIPRNSSGSVFDDAALSSSNRSSSFSSRKSSADGGTSTQDGNLYQNIVLPESDVSVQRSAPIVIPSAFPSTHMAGSPNSISKVPIIIPGMGSHCFSPQTEDDFRDDQQCACPRHLYDNPPSDFLPLTVTKLEDKSHALDTSIYPSLLTTLPRSAPTTSKEKATLRNTSRRSNGSIKEIVVLKQKGSRSSSEEKGPAERNFRGGDSRTLMASFGSEITYECMHVKGDPETRSLSAYEKMTHQQDLRAPPQPKKFSSYASSEGVSKVTKTKATKPSIYENVGITNYENTEIFEIPPPLPPKGEVQSTTDHSVSTTAASEPEEINQHQTSIEESRSRKTKSRFFADDTSLFEQQPPFPRKNSQRSKSLRTAYQNVSFTSFESASSNVGNSPPSRCSRSAPTYVVERFASNAEGKHALPNQSPQRESNTPARISRLEGSVSPDEAAARQRIPQHRPPSGRVNTSYENISPPYGNLYDQVRVVSKEERPPPLPPKQSRDRPSYSSEDQGGDLIFATRIASPEQSSTPSPNCDDDSGKFESRLCTTLNPLSRPSSSLGFTTDTDYSGPVITEQSMFDDNGTPHARDARLRASSSPQLSHRIDYMGSSHEETTPIRPPRRQRKESKNRPQSLHGSSLSNSLTQCVIVDISNSPNGQKPYDTALGRESIVAKFKAHVPVETEKNGPPIPPRDISSTERHPSGRSSCSENSSSPFDSRQENPTLDKLTTDEISRNSPNRTDGSTPPLPPSCSSLETAIPLSTSNMEGLSPLADKPHEDASSEVGTTCEQVSSVDDKLPTSVLPIDSPDQNSIMLSKTDKESSSESDFSISGTTVDGETSSLNLTTEPSDCEELLFKSSECDAFSGKVNVCTVQDDAAKVSILKEQTDCDPYGECGKKTDSALTNLLLPVSKEKEKIENDNSRYIISFETSV